MSKLTAASLLTTTTSSITDDPIDPAALELPPTQPIDITELIRLEAAG